MIGGGAVILIVCLDAMDEGHPVALACHVWEEFGKPATTVAMLLK